MYLSPNQAAEFSIVGPAALQITPVLCISMYTNRVHFLAPPFRRLGFWDYYFISTVIGRFCFLDMDSSETWVD